MASIKYENSDFPLGEEVFVKNLGTLINGQSVEFSDEQIARFESLRGEGAFRKIAHTDQLDQSLFELSNDTGVEEESEPSLLFPSTPELPTVPEGGNE